MNTLDRTIENITYLDRFSLNWIAGRRRPSLDILMQGFTRAGDWQTWSVLILAASIMGEPFRKVAFQITPKLLLTFLICYAIKGVLKRPRPTQAIQGFSSLLKDPDPHSFPSSHSACAWVVCVSLAITFGGTWPLWCSYATLISYSRVHVGAHYPLDVLIGSGIGAAIALLR